MGYTIKSVRIRNFKCFDNEKFYAFEFDNQNLVILTGPNGYGKTTLFDALEIAFSKRVTRIYDDVELKSTSNIMLNNSSSDGYIVLELVDENRFKTIIVKISSDPSKKSYIEKINYHCKDFAVAESDLLKAIENISAWDKSPVKINMNDFTQDKFNIFYYISQAESVHFLKNKLSSRKKTLNVLIDTSEEDNLIEFFEKMIGNNRNANSYWKIKKRKLETTIDEKVIDYRNLLIDKIESQKDITSSEYVSIFNDNEKFNWDSEKPNATIFKDMNSVFDILDVMHNLAVDFDDYTSHLNNGKLDNYIKNEKVLKDYIDYNDLLIEGQISKELIKEIESKNVKFRNCEFLLDIVELEEYDIDMVSRLCEVNNYFGEFIKKEKLQRIIDLTIKIEENDKLFLVSKKTQTDILNIREKLKKSYESSPGKSSNCPYCNSYFTTYIDLTEQYNKLSEILNSRIDLDAQQSVKLRNECYELVTEVKRTIINSNVYVSENDLIKEKQNHQDLSSFVTDANRKNHVIEIKSILSIKIENEELSIELLKSRLNDLKCEPKNLEFYSNLIKYDYKKMYDSQKNYIKSALTNLQNISIIENKKKYLKSIQAIYNDNEINSLKQNIEVLIKEKLVLDKLEISLRKLQIDTKKFISDKESTIMNHIRIPLLVYTSKILQDYQTGLGIYISKDNDNEMKFVSSGNPNHDILNTFSSGQLAAFVISFMLAMNKMFTNDSLLDFILIDDPVQTMDDINVTSFVEVLRRDFGKKQVILSTHEENKGRYIMYKFDKFNIGIKSINVKDEFYAL